MKVENEVLLFDNDNWFCIGQKPEMSLVLGFPDVLFWPEILKNAFYFVVVVAVIFSSFFIATLVSISACKIHVIRILEGIS